MELPLPDGLHEIAQAQPDLVQAPLQLLAMGVEGGGAGLALHGGQQSLQVPLLEQRLEMAVDGGAGQRIREVAATVGTAPAGYGATAPVGQAFVDKDGLAGAATAGGLLVDAARLRLGFAVETAETDM